MALNIPDVPQELAQRVARFTEFRAAGLADWHPRRREMLINTRFGETPQIHLVKAPGGARREVPETGAELAVRFAASPPRVPRNRGRKPEPLRPPFSPRWKASIFKR